VIADAAGSIMRVWDLAPEHQDTTIFGSAESLTFSPDDQILAWSDQAEIKLWDVAKAEMLRILPAEDGVTLLEFSPRARVLASSSARNGSITLWDVASGKQIRTLTGHPGLVMSLSFSADGRILASGGEDKTVKLWEVETGRELRTLTGHAKAVRCVALSKDGHVVASGSEDNTIKIWNTDTGLEIRTLTGYGYGLTIATSVAFSEDGKRLVSGNGGSVKQWDVASGNEIRSFQQATDDPLSEWRDARSVQVLPDGNARALVFRHHADRNLVLLEDPETEKVVLPLSLHEDWLRIPAFSPDGRFLATVDGRGAVLLWNISLLEASSARSSSDLLADSQQRTGLSFDRTKLVLSASHD
jgi:WD40 repeat protein